MSVLDTYSQITVTCVARDIDTVAKTVRSVLSTSAVRCTDSTAPLRMSDIYSGEPVAGGRHSKKIVLFAPCVAHQCTAAFANLVDGWLTLAVCMSKRIPDPVYRFALGSDKREWPRRSFDLLKGGETIRHVSVIKDVDRWKFWQQGEPLPEEDVAVYSKRRIRDRLTWAYLVALAERLGFPVGEDRFWESDSDAVYFEEQRPG